MKKIFFVALIAITTLLALANNIFAYNGYSMMGNYYSQSDNSSYQNGRGSMMQNYYNNQNNGNQRYNMMQNYNVNSGNNGYYNIMGY